ncbi:MAG: hypothetical protein JOY99_16060 [Sphingomonadaceae bacterium]|nr:hypothetical protein [Sphingomonadaceae bacterium]
MQKSATDIMQEIIFSAVIDSVLALKEGARGVQNVLLRDLNAVHPNTTFADLPPHAQAAIQQSVRAAFTRLLKEGYAVAPSIERRPPMPPRPPRPAGGRPPVVETKRRPRPRPDDGGNKPPRGKR